MLRPGGIALPFLPIKGMGRRDAERVRKLHTTLNFCAQIQTQDFFTVKQKLFYITPQPSAKHIIEFPSLQCNIFKTDVPDQLKM
jgi:hypothetical protein